LFNPNPVFAVQAVHVVNPSPAVQSAIAVQVVALVLVIPPTQRVQSSEVPSNV